MAGSSIAGRPAEEFVEAGVENGKRVLAFYGETKLVEPSTFAAPQVSISMKMGGQVPGLPLDADHIDASLSNDEALKLWDSIVKSVRLRPGAL